jgi:hypothetical protein
VKSAPLVVMETAAAVHLPVVIAALRAVMEAGSAVVKIVTGVIHVPLVVTNLPGRVVARAVMALQDKADRARTVTSAEDRAALAIATMHVHSVIGWRFHATSRS